ncbi:ABC1 kinase family protein [Alkalihalobacillus pseudalcaliphilus]|uniref:ABC1 kinase family protein n=1 Tax=Alkalihalobacillus pseudalcaliphilus TaxID=79884 RepID=UPI00064E151F|nr:AarF/ABC1/UbiB kinase family protein [Alkalihalobacillus pseudalcaliphilus]KMK76950.1 ABC transporter [Alkalihalobacillus pseudalcaliphilus]
MKRYREIAVAFTRNGFGYIVNEIGLHEVLSLPKRIFTKNRKDNHEKTTGERIRLFLEELGPTFVKLGQIASTRPDLIPADIIKELEKLQDHVKPFPFQEVKLIIEKELELKLEDVFVKFEMEPRGSASIGQVHYAELKNGESVAVKVQRPNIEKQVRTDIEILKELAKLAEQKLDWAAQYQVADIIDEFSKALKEELDYFHEGRNAGRMQKQLEDLDYIKIPKVYWDFSSKRVLTMEYMEGIHISDNEQLVEQGINPELIAERIVEAVMKQILMDGFFHSDPHPGNMTILDNQIIGLMDFGMVGRLTPDMKSHLASLIIGMMKQNTNAVIKAIMKMGIVPDRVDHDLLRADVDVLRDKYYDVPLSQVSLGEAVTDLFSVAHHHGIQIPADLTLVGKTLLTMEGLVVRLYPEISIIDIAEPFGRKLIMERYRPKRVVGDSFEYWGEYMEIVKEGPQYVKEARALFKDGKFPIEVVFPKAVLFLNKLDRVSNQLSFAIVLLAFSIIMVGLIIGSAISQQSSLLWNIPAIEIGFGIAVLMFLWLLYSIFRSGRF